MKLKELNEGIATTCNVRGQVVNAVQGETFRQLRAALEKGERVIIPEFGIFMLKDVAGEEGAPAKKVIKFKSKTGEKKGKGGGKKKQKGEAKAETAAEGDDEE